MKNVLIKNSGDLIQSIQNKDITTFKLEFSKQVLCQEDKQLLLIMIFDEYYDFKNYSFFKKVFDIIIESKINLNFKIENHWVDSLLSLIVLNAPHIQLLDYFIDKGAKLNYAPKPSDKYDEIQTCLDYAEMKFYDAVSENEFEFSSDINPNLDLIHQEEMVCINKSDYLGLIERAKKLNDIYETYKLINHIIAIGGKRFAEL